MQSYLKLKLKLGNSIFIKKKKNIIFSYKYFKLQINKSENFEYFDKLESFYFDIKQEQFPLKLILKL